MTPGQNGHVNHVDGPRPLSEHAESIRKAVDKYRADHDPEHIHAIRVATRRIRAAIDSAAANEATMKLNAGVKALAESLGQTRDADVIGALIEEQVERQLPHLRIELAPLLDEISQDREEFREIALRRFRSPYLNVLLKDLRGFEPGEPETDEPSDDAAQQLERRWRELKRANRRRKQTGSPEHLHRMRVVAKKIRYAIEQQSDGPAQRIRKQVKPVRKLQNLLGEIHDLHMAAERVEALLEVGRGSWSPESVAAGEQLLYILNRRAERLTGKVDKKYKAARRVRKRIGRPDDAEAVTSQ